MGKRQLIWSYHYGLMTIRWIPKFHKIWVEYYCLSETWASEIFCSKFNWSQSPYQLQKLSTIGPQQPTWAKFLEFEFFFIWKDKIIDIIRRKNQAGLALSSYIYIAMKLLIKSENVQKSGKIGNFLAFILCKTNNGRLKLLKNLIYWNF